METYKTLYFPHQGKPYFYDACENDFSCSEYLIISPYCYLIYNITHKTPNKALAEFGNIFCNIPGDGILIYNDENGEQTDIPDNIFELLPQILEKDTRKRLKFVKKFREIATDF